MTKYLSREDILTASDIVKEDCYVPEWGGTVRVRGLTGNERDKYEQSIVTMKGRTLVPKLTGAMARLVSLSVIDEDGGLEFSEEDVIALGRKSAGGLQRVYEVARRLSGLSEQDMEDLVGNSESETSGSSTSDSRSPSVAPSRNSSTPSAVGS